MFNMPDGCGNAWTRLMQAFDRDHDLMERAETIWSSYTVNEKFALWSEWYDEKPGDLQNYLAYYLEWKTKRDIVKSIYEEDILRVLKYHELISSED